MHPFEAACFGGGSLAFSPDLILFRISFMKYATKGVTYSSQLERRFERDPRKIAYQLFWRSESWQARVELINSVILLSVSSILQSLFISCRISRCTSTNSRTRMKIEPPRTAAVHWYDSGSSFIRSRIVAQKHSSFSLKRGITE